jgi:hypothetical protein
MRTVYWNVAPRYTAGSPAMVDEVTARLVAKQEKHAIIGVLEGSCGEELRKQAEQLGLAGIVWSSMELGKATVIIDLLTGETRNEPRQRK